MAEPTLLTELNTHIATLLVSPTSSTLDTKLFGDAELILPQHIAPAQTLNLVKSLAALLQVVHTDLTPVVDLLIRLLDPLTFETILEFEPAVEFAAGLGLEVPGCVNRLMLVLLDKAAAKASDAAVLATMPDVIFAVVKLWLGTSDVGNAVRAGDLLVDLLRVDQEPANYDGLGSGQGLVWKRVFGDVDVYGLVFEMCSFEGKGVDISKAQRSLAQARVLEWVPTIATMDWGMLLKSHHGEVEGRFGVKIGGGLMDFVALEMVDTEGDLLMAVALVEFYAKLLGAVTVTESRGGKSGPSSALDWLIEKGVHKRTANLYLQDADTIDARFLYGTAADYLATYAAAYPDHFQSSDLGSNVKGRLDQAFDLSAARWAHADSLKHDLHLLASLPRTSLLPGSSTIPGSWSGSPLAQLPSKVTNADVLDTLAIIFHGPPKREIAFPPKPHSDRNDAARDEVEASAARVLYYAYLSHNPLFWQNIITHGNTVALPDVALAAINVITAVITAAWSVSPSHSAPVAPFPTPAAGHLAVLSPPALEYILPFLLSPAISFSHLVGGRGDSESAAYRIGVAKFEALKALKREIEEQVRQEPGVGYEDILMTLNRRVAMGVTGGRQVEAGESVATMDM